MDDPVQIYLRQLSQFPLASRQREVEISERIENATEEITRFSTTSVSPPDITLPLPPVCRAGFPRNDSSA